ncbi:phosphopantetheine-binding protein [Streptomyces vietnamensis]|uniref:phosphopantetheine-binding protein n=1 Tax=Streptomyces vietnamensis TaxID=362257 RepID=UPI0037B7E751
MNPRNLDEFLLLLHDEFSIDLRERGAGTYLADVPEWDSVLLLQLVTVLEEETGRRLPVRSLFEARTFEQIYALVKEQG